MFLSKKRKEKNNSIKPSLKKSIYKHYNKILTDKTTNYCLIFNGNEE
jgi:hypothetical protein